jgi:hypothetical protein
MSQSRRWGMGCALKMPSIIYANNSHLFLKLLLSNSSGLFSLAQQSYKCYQEESFFLQLVIPRTM